MLPENGTYRNVDLTSWQTANDSQIITGIGYDYPHYNGTVSSWVYDFRGTGKLSLENNTWEMLAWGYDTNGDAYWVAYETPVAFLPSPCDIDLLSRVKGAPSNATRHALLEGIRKLDIEELTNLTDQVVALPVDDRRNDLGPTTCNEACVGNVDI